MLVCRDSQPVAASAEALGDVETWVRTMDSRGVRITGNVLAPESEAVAVRIRDAEKQVATGAHLSTSGELLGFDLLECKDMAEAIDVAAAHPLARRYVFEIRPVSHE
jgi:hypothetical protein